MGIDLEADPRHAEIVVREFGLEGATPSKVPGAKTDDEAEEHTQIKNKPEAPAESRPTLTTGRS